MEHNLIWRERGFWEHLTIKDVRNRLKITRPNWIHVVASFSLFCFYSEKIMPGIFVWVITKSRFALLLHNFTNKKNNKIIEFSRVSTLTFIWKTTTTGQACRHKNWASRWAIWVFLVTCARSSSEEITDCAALKTSSFCIKTNFEVKTWVSRAEILVQFRHLVPE